MPPAAEPTTLQLVTLAIAILGLVIAVASLGLGIRRDRREVKADVAIDASISGADVVVTFTNVSHRPLSIARAGFSSSMGAQPRALFSGWRPRGGGIAAGRIVADDALPSPALHAGEPAYVVRAPMHLVKAATYPAGPVSVWCEDERGNFYREQLSPAVKQAVAATKRRDAGPMDDYGQPTEIEIEDD